MSDRPAQGRGLAAGVVGDYVQGGDPADRPHGDDAEPLGQPGPADPGLVPVGAALHSQRRGKVQRLPRPFRAEGIRKGSSRRRREQLVCTKTRSSRGVFED